MDADNIDYIIEKTKEVRRELLYLECEELTEKQAELLSNAIDLLYDFTDKLKEEKRYLMKTCNNN